MAAAKRPPPNRTKPAPKDAAVRATRPTPEAPPAARVAPGARVAPATGVDWVSFVLICAIAVFSALLELMLIPLYIGSIIIPISVVGAIASNVVLPWWGHRTIGRGLGAVLPVVCWLIVILGLSVVTRPEGDIFVSAAFNQNWVYYGVILLGAVAGFTTVLRATNPAPAPR